MKRQIISLLFMFSLASAASGVTDYDKVITRIGTQGSNSYFYVENGFSGGCLYNVVYAPSTNTFGKFAYAQLLTAKAMNTPLRRIDYAINPQGICVLTLIEIAD